MSVSMRAGPAAPQAVAGGFVLVPVPALMSAWRACRSRPLGVGDFRTWLACREMLARRCRPGRGRSPGYGYPEVSRLTGVSLKRARASVNRLVTAGHLAWSGHALAFPNPPGPDTALADTVGGGRGDLAVPRRVLRALTRGARPALLATALAVLLRCVSRGRGGFRSRGRLKASWVALAFGVDARRVKQARKELVELGWIVPESADQWSLNRWGAVYRVDLAWRGAGPADRPRLPPPAAAKGRRLAPPESDPEPLRGNKNQEPGGAGPTGFNLREAMEEAAEAAPRPPKVVDGASPSPTLNDVRAEDLKDTGRLLVLHRQAVNRGLVGPGEADRLKFLAAAEHARAVGKKNPGGLFARLVHRGWWRFATQGDEDAASARLKRYLFGRPRAGVGGARPPAIGGLNRSGGPRLSADALLAREVRAAVARAGHRGDPFPLVRARDPSWTRPRWDAALAELSTGSGGL